MADLVYDTASIEQARTAAAGEAGRVMALGDRITTLPPTAFGQLASSAAMVGAVAQLTRAFVVDLHAGGTHLQEVDRALDATIRAMQRTDGAAAESLTPDGG